MTQYPLIAWLGAGVILHAAATALSAPPSNPPIPPPAALPAPPPPSLEADAQKLLQVVIATLDTGWQRVGSAMDEFFKLPPEPPAPEPVPAAAPAATTVSTPPPPAAPAAPQPPPAAPVQPTPPVQTAKVVPPPVAPPASTPAPATPPPSAPAAAAQTPAPEPKPAVAAVTPPAQPPAPKPVAPAPPAGAMPAKPATASVPPSLISSLPVQRAGSSSTQAVVNPTKTNTNLLSGTNALKYLVAKYISPTVAPGKRAAHNATVSLDVRRVVKRKYLPDATDTPTLGALARAHYRETAILHITVENQSPQMLTNVVIQWGVLRKNVARDSTSKPVLHGAREEITLKPIDVKNIETTPVEVEGRIDQNVGRSWGDIIRGHAVQVLIGTNVIAEEISPPSLKFSFKDLQPVPKPLPPIQQ